MQTLPFPRTNAYSKIYDIAEVVINVDHPLSGIHLHLVVSGQVVIED